MSYRIEYQNRGQIASGRLPLMTVMCCLLFLLLVYRFWPEGASVIRGILQTVRNSSAVAALDGAARKLQEGERVFQVFSDCFQSLRP